MGGGEKGGVEPLFDIPHIQITFDIGRGGRGEAKEKRLQQLAPWQQQPCALLLPGSSSAVPLQLPELIC